MTKPLETPVWRYRASRITALATAVYVGRLSLVDAQSRLDAGEQIGLLARLTSIRKGNQPCRRLNR